MRSLSAFSQRIRARFSRLTGRNRYLALGLLPAALMSVALVTVHPGDTLSHIAQARCGSAADWTGIYAANRATIGADPNLILPGQRLAVRCAQATVAQPAASAEEADAPAATRPAMTSSATIHATSSFQACVIARESGGNSQIMNATGHYGLYQFSASTWAAYGGNPADFGNASAAEQTRVFDNAIAAGGQSNWSPYDGC